ncbi:putative membrane protein [Staphylococcus auricularis]
MTRAYKSYLITLLFFMTMTLFLSMIGMDFISAMGWCSIVSIVVFFFFNDFFFENKRADSD